MHDVSAAEIVTSPKRGCLSSVLVIEKQYPGYLHFLYRKSIDIKGSSMSFEEIAKEMNALSQVASDPRPPLNLSRKLV